MLITSDAMEKILRAGGGLRISARALTTDTVVELARAAANSGATLILHDFGVITSDDLIRIAQHAVGRVIFEVERDV
jgi:hypothetical protein